MDRHVSRFYPGDVLLRECGFELGRPAGNRCLCVDVDDVLHGPGGDVVENDVGPAAAVVIPGDVVPADRGQPLVARIGGESCRRRCGTLVEVDIPVPVPVVLPGDVVSRYGRFLLRGGVVRYPCPDVTVRQGAPEVVYGREKYVLDSFFLFIVSVVFPDDRVAVDIRTFLRSVEGTIDRLPRGRYCRHSRRYQQPDGDDCVQQCQMRVFFHVFPP
ncbi:hypothetical protein DSECCO2_576180 [anaerobic digester metagenome]